ncbi:MAG TPA: cell wall hydrolase [Allosphingosinicella sp.]|jgi:spore germination cell wall hydrolase CwlJ-like protein|nr:cell wall hydrolase [Allosphingosinicella sp.]
MIRLFRAAAVAATALLFAALASAPAAAAADASFANHGIANPPVSALGLNGDTPSVAAFSGALGEHMTGLAGVAAPTPRSLEAEVEALAAAETRGAEEDCLANAVYFEARGESIEGQLAVAEVVMNRASSGRYPPTLCGVVVQRSQFSFVHGGIIPAADRGSHAWRRAVAVARVALAGTTRLLPTSVLWYHANYVSPGWGRRLARTSRIGAHIFYR